MMKLEKFKSNNGQLRLSRRVTDDGITLYTVRLKDKKGFWRIAMFNATEAQLKAAGIEPPQKDIPTDNPQS